MFKPLRKKRFVKITMWALVVTFVLWGAGSAVTTRMNYAGTIFGKRITLQQYRHNYAACYNRAKMLYGDKLSKVLKYLDLHSQTWDRLILSYEAKKRRIKATNKEVVERITSFPAFMKGGSFDKKTYQYILKHALGVAPRDFEETVREDIIIVKLRDVVQESVSVTDNEVKNAYIQENEKADISFILLEPQAFKDKVSVQEEELLPYYQSHKQQFLTPVKVDVEYIEIPFSIEADESEEKPKHALSKDEAKQKAQLIKDYLNTGYNFEQAVEEHSIKIKNTGPFSLGSAVPEIGLSFPFSLAAFSLNDKEPLSDIVEDKDAFYIIKFKERIPSFIPDFDKVKEDVKNALIANKGEGLAEEKAKEYIAKINSSKISLEVLAKEEALDLQKAEDITRKGYIKGIGEESDFASGCFSIKEGEITGPLKVEKGYAIVRLDKLKPIDEKKFEEEKKEFKEGFTKQKKERYFNQWFQALKLKANPKSNTLKENMP